MTPGAGLFVSSPEPPSSPLSLCIALCNKWNSVKVSAQMEPEIRYSILEGRRGGSVLDVDLRSDINDAAFSQ